MYKPNIYYSMGLVLALLCTGAFQTMAQPDWSVNASDYEFTMTVTGIGLFQCVESMDENDMVAAFVGEECRGVQFFNTNIEGQMLAYLTVYDNLPEGSTVTFKLYDASEDKVYDDVFPIEFQENGITGNPAMPHEFKTDFVLTDMILSNGILYDYDVKGTAFTEVLSINENGDTSAFMIDFIDEEGVDNGFFSIMGNQLVLEEDVDYKNKTEYQIHLLAISDVGCEFESVFTIIVENTNVPPTGIAPDQISFNENEEEGTVITPLIAIDESTIDIHTYALVGDDVEWPDNSSFQIVDTTLQSAVVFDYETKDFYRIQVEVTDRVGNTYIDTLEINIMDVIEFDDLKAGNLVTPNDDGFNDFFEIPNVDLFANYVLCIFNDNGNRVYRKERYQNTWDGRNKNGARLPNGTYYFTLQEKGKEQNAFKGSIYLLRTNNY
jgi:gliding motility-associated-like protein